MIDGNTPNRLKSMMTVKKKKKQQQLIICRGC